MSPSKYTQKSSSKWVAKEDSSKWDATKDSKSGTVTSSTSILHLLHGGPQAQVQDAVHPPASKARTMSEAKAEKPRRRRMSDDEETAFESEEGVSISSSGDESWNSHQDQLQSGRAVGKQLLSLIKQPETSEKQAKSAEPQASEANSNSKPGRTKLSLGAAAFCPTGVAPQTQTDHLLDKLRTKLSSDSPPSGVEVTLEVLHQQSCTSALNSQAVPEILQSPSINSVLEKDHAAPSSKGTPCQSILLEDVAAPPSKPARTPLGRTPLSSKAEAFQPGKLNFAPVPAACAPFLTMHSGEDHGMWQPYFPQIPNGFKLGFSPEMPQHPPGTLQKPCAEDAAPMPFECLIGKYQVSNGILVSKDTSPEDSPYLEEAMPTSTDCSTPRHNDSMPFPQLLPTVVAGADHGAVGKDPWGVAPCSPASSSTATPVPQQKISWADLSDDIESSPWMQVAAPQDKLD